MMTLKLLIGLFFLRSVLGMTEKGRIQEYHARNYTWPPKSYVPDNPGWKKLMDRRFRQVTEIPDRKQRYEGFIQTVNAALLAPNFTEYGFGLGRAPDELMEELRRGIREGLEKGPRLEKSVEIIGGDQAWFVDRPDLTRRVLVELQTYPENWAGVELTPVTAYGFRLYRNNSELHMHVDKSQTHIISFILHIDSSEDSEPWPILIEDFNGNTHEVILTSGDMLFYESSKCFHGRPHRFKGSWYSSIFVHYYPKYGWADTNHEQERHYALPPEWSHDPTTANEVPLKMIGTSMQEPSCPNNWCATEHTIKWSGPGEEGYWIAPKGEKFPLEREREDLPCTDMDYRCKGWASSDTDECHTNPEVMLTKCKKSCNACTTVSGFSSDEL